MDFQTVATSIKDSMRAQGTEGTASTVLGIETAPTVKSVNPITTNDPMGTAFRASATKPVTPN